MSNSCEFSISMDEATLDALATVACNYDGIEVGDDEYAYEAYERHYSGMNKLSYGFKKAISEYIMREGMFAEGGEFEGVDGYFFGKV